MYFALIIQGIIVVLLFFVNHVTFWSKGFIILYTYFGITDIIF